jgi:hypothetical protein
MMSDVETALRATLVAAESTAPAPDDLADRLLAATTDPHGALPPLLAAAAVVAVVIGVTLGVRTGSTRPTQRPTPSLRSTPSKPPGTLTPLRCMTSLPSAWQNAPADATTIGAPSLLYGDLAMDGAGDLLAVQYTASHAYRVLLLRHGSAPRSLYETPAGQPSPEQAMAIRSLGAAGTWAALTVVVGQRVQIMLIDLTTDSQATVRTVPSGFDMLSDVRVVSNGAAESGLTIADGSLYWAEIGAGQHRGRLYRFDIATGKRHVLDSAVTSGPLALAGGTLYWRHSARIGTWPTGAVPTGVDWRAHPAVVATSTGDLVWQDRSGAIEAARPGESPTVLVPARRNWLLESASGDFVFAQNRSGIVVLDLRTGAAARWSAADDRLAYASATAVVLSRKGGFDVIDATQLPSLGC